MVNQKEDMKVNTQQHLLNIGLNDQQAENFLQAFSDFGELRNQPEKHWVTVSRWLHENQISISVRESLWQEVFSTWDEAVKGPRPMWLPDEQTVSASNITVLMRQTGHHSYEELYRWSIEERPAFWQNVVEQLQIVFQKPADNILDLSDSAENPQWLCGAQLNIVESCFQADPNVVAIVSGGVEHKLTSQTYGELRQLVNRVSNSILAAGFQHGDRLAIVMPMNCEAVAIYLGIIQAGCTVVSIADSFAAAEIRSRLQIAEAKGVFCVGRFQRSGKTIGIYKRIIEAESPKAIVLTDPTENKEHLRDGDCLWSDFLKEDNSFTPRYTDPESFINILYSSGTTGQPKAIPWNHTTAIKSAADGLYHQDIHPGDVVVWPTNLGWMMGPWLIFATLMNRATIGLYTDAPTTDGFGRFIQDTKTTMLGVVPTIVAAWRTSGCMEKYDWSAIRCFSSTGEVSHYLDMFYLSALAGHKPIIEYCGGTEVGGGYLASSVLQPNAPSTFSTPTLGTEFVILNDQQQQAEQGELYLIPPTIGFSTMLLNRDHHQTYYENTPENISNVPLRRHGDQIQRLSNGYYAARGRVDDTMNLGGIKVSSAEIERVLSQVESLKEVVAIAARPHENGPTSLVTFAVLEPSDADDFDTAKIEKIENYLLSQFNQRIKRELNPLFKVALSSLDRFGTSNSLE